MEWQDRISIDPRILAGKPLVKGTRISVEMVLDLLAGGWTTEQVLENYPTLKPDDVRTCSVSRHEIRIRALPGRQK